MTKALLQVPKLSEGLQRPRAIHAFSLIEVIVAIGIATYVLLVIASLLPVGVGAIQTSNQQVTRTEIYNQLWSEMNATPYSDLQTNTRIESPSYFDINGNETNQASAVFTVVCTEPGPGSMDSPNPGNGQLPPTSGGSNDTNDLNAVQIKIGYHIDPTTITPGTDPRVTARTFLLARQDGSTNAVPNGW